MERILIADGSGVYASRIAKELADEFYVECCGDGNTAVEKLHTFDPDVLVLDTVLPGIDSFTLLHILRTSGRNIGVVVLSDLTDPLTMRRLSDLGISYVLPKPCALNAVIANIKDLVFRLRYPDMEDWCVDNEIDRMLLSLSFKMGLNRNRVLWQAIAYRYEHPDSSYTKEVCPTVAKLCGGSATQVEKAIRDAIRCAFISGDKMIWKMYFPAGGDGEYKHPGADEFIARLAQCLIQRTRLKPPYIPQKELAK